CGGECRMTGGHVKFINDTCETVEDPSGVGMVSVTPVTIKLNNSLATRNQTVKYTVGGQIGAPQAGCCDTPPSSPGRDENCPGGSWQHTHHQGLVSWGDSSTFSGGFGFHSGTASAPVDAYIKCINCSDPGWCVQARCAPFKQIFWEGTGVFHNIDPASKFQSCATIVPDDKKSNKPPTIHYYQAHVGDFGEPDGCNDKQEPAQYCDWTSGGVDSSPDIGSSPDPKFGDRGGEICDECADWYEIEIHCTADPASPIIYRVGNFMTHGNYQIHPQVGQNCFDTYPQR
ncbi:MAG: hypothetical protein V1764_04315, partial [Nitrospirota bacterium]